MKRFFALVVSLYLVLVGLSTALAAPANHAEWTVLVYMNGHNNLEDDIPINFRQMSSVGSTNQVNIVVQVAKLGAGLGGDIWRDKVFRYRITKGMTFDPANAVMTLGQVDMGSPDTLKNFIEWGAANYPAKHYMLVMWGHGQGYRLQMIAASMQHRLNGLTSMNGGAMPVAIRSYSTTPSVSPYRTVSSDDVFNSKLYMSDLQRVLKDVVSNDTHILGSKVDVLTFDACLMSMIENAYAFRDVAQIMVASQDLDPGRGLAYGVWLAALVNAPTMEPAKTGALLVETFAEAYQTNDGTTTMAAIDLSKANTLAQDTSSFAEKMTAALPGALAEISAARAHCPYYAPDPFSDGHDYFYHIDLGCFVDGLAQSHDPTLKSAANQVKQDLKAAVLESYAGSERVSFGSNGLCIYFPKSRNEFNGDLFAEGGYIKTNQVHPVEFVQKLKWADFLSAYYSALDGKRPAPTAASALRISFSPK